MFTSCKWNFVSHGITEFADDFWIVWFREKIVEADRGVLRPYPWTQNASKNCQGGDKKSDIRGDFFYPRPHWGLKFQIPVSLFLVAYGAAPKTPPV